MLDGPLPDHHISDTEVGIEPAGDTGEQDHFRLVVQDQLGGNHGCVDLPDPRFDEHDIRRVEPRAQQLQLAGDGGHDSNPWWHHPRLSIPAGNFGAGVQR